MLPDARSRWFEVTAEPPASVTVHQAFGIQVTAIDQFGSPDPDFNGSITVAWQAADDGASSGNAHGDRQQWSGHVLRAVCGSGGPRIHAHCQQHGAWPGRTSNSFTVVAGPASKLLITTEPLSSVAAGSPFSFVVTAEDQYGNMATSFNGNETITVADRAQRRSAHRNERTQRPSNGVATMSGLILTQAGSGYKLQVASTGLTSADDHRRSP